jgi:hypothetical protein
MRAFSPVASQHRIQPCSVLKSPTIQCTTRPDSSTIKQASIVCYTVRCERGHSQRPTVLGLNALGRWKGWWRGDGRRMSFVEGGARSHVDAFELGVARRASCSILLANQFVHPNTSYEHTSQSQFNTKRHTRSALVMPDQTHRLRKVLLQQEATVFSVGHCPYLSQNTIISPSSSQIL